MPISRAKIKISPIPSNDKDAEQLELSYVADGYGKWCNHLDNSLEVSHWVKNTLTIRPSNPSPSVFTQVK